MAANDARNVASEMPVSRARADAAELAVPSQEEDMEDPEEVEEEEEEEEEEEAGEEEEEDGGEAADEGDVQTGSTVPTSPPATGEPRKWPGWPGDNVFRMVVPVLKVGSIIGRKGELIKKLCEETRARVRVLDGPIGTADRIVLISGREETEAVISPAMNATLRVFKHVNGISESENGTLSAPASSTVCLVRLLVPSPQAVSLIGKGGTIIKSIQESSGAMIRVLSGGDVAFYATSDERIVEIQGDSLKVLKALEGVVGHLRKFLVDHGVLPLFEKSCNSAASSDPQERAIDSWGDKTTSLAQTSQTGFVRDYSLPLKRDSLFLGHETQLSSRIPHSGLSLYGQDPSVAGIRSSGFDRSAGAIVTQVTQTMRIPLSYADNIIGDGGKNIAYARRVSGAIITLQESRGLTDEMTVEIKGTAAQVQIAQEFIHEFISGHKEPAGSSYSSSYGGLDSGMRSSYSQLTNSSYHSSLTSQSYGGYGSSGISGYGGYRL